MNAVTTLTRKIADRMIKNQGSKSITIPNGFTSIGYAAFMERNLESVSIPKSVKRIGDSAFAFNNLSGKNAIKIPGSVTKIGPRAFYEGGLTQIDIPDSVTKIGRRAFYFNNLKSIDLPDRLVKIEEETFYGNSLRRVDIPDSVTTIGYSAFDGNELVDIEIPDSVSSIGRLAFAYNKFKNFRVPENIKYIGDKVLYGGDPQWNKSANSLKKVSIPADLVYGSNTFPKGAKIISRDPITGKESSHNNVLVSDSKFIKLVKDESTYLDVKTGSKDRKIKSKTDKWDTLMAVETESGYEVLLFGTSMQLFGNYKVITVDSSGEVQKQTRWKPDEWMERKGYEDLFGIDLYSTFGSR